jgi:hypothetical protein
VQACASHLAAEPRFLSVPCKITITVMAHAVQPSPGLPRRAVIAIHGVGSPKPGTTAAAAVGLLSATGSYSQFEQTTVHIPLVRTDDVVEFEERSETDQQFAAAQIRDFAGSDEAIYSTTVLRGVRKSDGSPTEVFELYWGDLSETKTAISFLVQAVFLPFRFMLLGELAHRVFTSSCCRRLWSFVGRFYRLARRLTTIVLPVLLLEALFLAGIAATTNVPAHICRWLGALVLGVGMAATLAVTVHKRLVCTSAFQFALTPVVGGLLAGIGGFVFFPEEGGSSSFFSYLSAGHLITAEIVVLGWLFVDWLLSLFDESGGRTLARWSWRLISIMTGLACINYFYKAWRATVEGTSGFDFFSPPIPANSRGGVAPLIVDLLTADFGVAYLLAVLVLGLIVLCFLCAGWIYVALRGENRRELRRTAWTMWFGLSVTIIAIEVPLVAAPVLLSLPPFSWAALDTSGGFVTADVIVAAWAMMMSGVPIGGIAAVSILLGASIFAFGPSLYAEFLPSSTWKSNQSGWWLTNGLAFVTASTVLAGVCTTFFPATWLFILAMQGDEKGESMLTGVAKAFGEGFWRIAVVSFITIALRASAVTSRVVKTVIGLALDVELYLRDRPRDKTTRALIYQRFLTLYEYLDRQQYDQIVLIAHSQGTVILMDALRFMHLSCEGKSASKLNSESVKSVITMGSPLRQLYASAFPQLFGWAFRAEPGLAGVHNWLNLYRSGDYVGRQLTQADKAPGVYDENAETTSGSFRERCIGSGAHTHYWNSPVVAHELDRVISEFKGRGMQKPVERS